MLILQTDWEHEVWAVTILLFLVSIAQGYVLHFNLASDVTASRLMGNQLHKLAEKWRLLWICQDRKGIERWVEHLEDVTNHVTVYHLSTYRHELNEQCQKEAYDELGGTVREEEPPLEIELRLKKEGTGEQDAQQFANLSHLRNNPPRPSRSQNRRALQLEGNGTADTVPFFVSLHAILFSNQVFLTQLFTYRAFDNLLHLVFSVERAAIVTALKFVQVAVQVLPARLVVCPSESHASALTRPTP